MDGYVTFLCLAGGAGITVFWVFALATRKVETFGDFGVTRSWHIAAELMTAAMLLVAGFARIADPDRERPQILTALALGALLYACVQSPGYYLKRARILAYVLAATALGAAVALAHVLRG